MRKDLPAVGTAELLRAVSDLVPDDFINQLLPRRRGVGRRCYFSAAQMWRVHLLSPLTGTHSFNGIVRLLPEQRIWRRFAHLSHRERTPDLGMLHEFRDRAGVGGLRAINDHLVMKLLKHLRAEQKSVAVIDAYLPAAYWSGCCQDRALWIWVFERLKNWATSIFTRKIKGRPF
jgi:Transposase domain (DUF772)